MNFFQSSSTKNEFHAKFRNENNSLTYILYSLVVCNLTLNRLFIREQTILHLK